MEKITAEKTGKLRHLFENATRIAVLGHTHPDGDALGSVSALCSFLGRKATAIFPDSLPETLRFAMLPEVPYLFADSGREAAEAAIAEADLVVLLDCNAFSRTDVLEGALKASGAPKILIDHHLNPDLEAFDLVFSTPDISSASELLYWILKEIGPLSLPACTALLTGMTTDTNNFANSVYPSTFRMASELLAAGVDRDAVLARLYNNYRENRVRLMGYMQHEELHILPEGAAYMILSREIQERFDLAEGESEGLVNVPLSIGRVRLSLLLKEQDGHWRVSLRSKKGTSAQQCAQRFFHGGGHENAAGGKLTPGEDYTAPEGLVPYLENALKAVL